MKRLIILLAIFFLTGCGAYLKSGAENFNDARIRGEGFYWYDGRDNLEDCVHTFHSPWGWTYYSECLEIWVGINPDDGSMDLTCEKWEK